MKKLSKDEEERALSLHDRAIVIDGCNAMFPEDVRWRRNKGERKVMETRHLPRIQAGGITAFITTMSWAPIPWPTPLRVLTNIGFMHIELEESLNKMVLATRAQDIKNAKKDKKVAIIFGLQNAQSVVGPAESDLTLLKVYHKLGVRCIQVTYNERNMFGDGCLSRKDSGLSDLGVKLIEEMNKLGIIVDLSHVGKGTFMDAVEISKDPVIVSHTNVRFLHEHPRCITDEQIKMIAEKDGVIGLTACYSFVGPTIEQLLDHIDYIVNLVGINHVGLGFDFYAYAYDVLGYVLHWKPSGRQFAEDIEDETKVPNVTKGLVARGYSDEEIMKILGQNFIRVFERVWGS